MFVAVASKPPCVEPARQLYFGLETKATSQIDSTASTFFSELPLSPLCRDFGCFADLLSSPEGEGFSPSPVANLRLR